MAEERAIVVGAGDVSNAWFPPLAAEGVRVAAVVDIRLEAARAQIGRYGLEAEASSDLAAMLGKYSPDVVIDLTVPSAHCEVTCTTLRAGAHVLGEKPMATSLGDARRMIAASEETGRMFMVSQSRRWDRQRDVVRRVVRSGALGAVTMVNCEFCVGVHPGGFREEMASPLLLDVAVHHFDLLRFMTGLEPATVYCREYSPIGSWFRGAAAASAVFEMEGGAVFTYVGSRCAEGCRTSRSGDWRIVGTQGTVVYENDEAPHGELVVGDEGIDRPVTPLSIPSPVLEFEGMHGALREMLAYLRGGPVTQCECHDNMRSLAMALSAIESSARGERVVVQGTG